MLRVLPFLFLLAACASPPSKEMNQAQGAIDAARAAGADRYAQTDLTAAVDALTQSERAVADRDYRLALSLAIDSRERAQNAARIAGETRARLRGDAERHLAELAALVTQTRQRLNEPATTRLPVRTVQESRKLLDAAEKNMQEARAALASEDYPRAIRLTEDVGASLRATLKVLTPTTASPPSRRRR